MTFPPSAKMTPSDDATMTPSDDATIEDSTLMLLEQQGETDISDNNNIQSSTIERGTCLFAFLECVVYTSFLLLPLTFFGIVFMPLSDDAHLFLILFLYLYIASIFAFAVLLGALGRPNRLAWAKYLDDEPSSVMEVQGRVTKSREGDGVATCGWVTIQYVVATKKDGEDVCLLYQIRNYQIRKNYHNEREGIPGVGADVSLLVLPGYPKSAKLTTDMREAKRVAQQPSRVLRVFSVLFGLSYQYYFWFLFPITIMSLLNAVFGDDSHNGFALYLAVLLLIFLQHTIIYVLFWVIFPIVVRGWELEGGTLVGSLSDTGLELPLPALTTNDDHDDDTDKTMMNE